MFLLLLAAFAFGQSNDLGLEIFAPASVPWHTGAEVVLRASSYGPDHNPAGMVGKRMDVQLRARHELRVRRHRESPPHPNTAEATIGTVPPSTLEVVVSATPMPAYARDVVTYTYAITNHGPQPSNNVPSGKSTAAVPPAVP